MAFMDRVPHVEITPYAPNIIGKTAQGHDILGADHQERLDDLREHYAACEDWWDIDPEDYEKLSDMKIVEDVILMSKVTLGQMYACKKYSLSEESVRWLVRRFLQRVKEGDRVALTIRRRIGVRVCKGEVHLLKKQLHNQRRCEMQILNGVA